MAAAGLNGHVIMHSSLRPFLLRIDGVFLAMDNVVVDAVLDIMSAIGNAEDALRVGLVFREEERRRPFAVKVAFAQFRMDRFDRVADALQARPVGDVAPRPLIAEPQRRQDVQFRCLRTTIVDGDLNQDVFGRVLGVFDEHVEIPILVEDAGVEQLILELITAAALAGVNEACVGNGACGYL